MIGILLITHYGLGNSLKQCAEHVFGPDIPALAVLGIEKADDPDQKIEEAKEILTSLNADAGVLVLTDLFGATPANIAKQLTQINNVHCISGVNLPMLIRSVSYRHLPMPELIDKAISGAHDGIIAIKAD
ncbi:PTS fructose transporter subunit IIA [Leeia sp. TBRC 13508]|uniref:PTS fructose transporter subunit IIA n=1 Tax=Leeia speluncae TaxID=2884804 RepID=A0ABS8D5A6_9NEIS|nr:PTS fructose transporter subunit IIA [Leeia speluncae]MCB6183389.1 PTS fructose transporter subunit IIA [Leeia speluncae]